MRYVIARVHDQQIIDDVLKNHRQGRHCLVLTLRTAHVEKLAGKLGDSISEIITLAGGMGRKQTRMAFERIAEIPVQMIQHLSTVNGKSIRITIVTRPRDDFTQKDHPVWQKAHDLLVESGSNIIFQPNIHQKFAIMDQSIVWYGSINLLSYGSAQESIMRIESSSIANELVKSMEKD